MDSTTEKYETRPRALTHTHDSASSNFILRILFFLGFVAGYFFFAVAIVVVVGTKV